MTSVAQGEGGIPFSVLLRLLDLPLLLQAEVLPRMGPRDLASLAGVDRACAAAVGATALMQWAKDEKSLPKRRSTHVPDHVYHGPRLCLRDACSLAACGGNLEVLKWLRRTGCPWDQWACYFAARGGHLEVLTWLRDARFPWTAATCAAAAASGHLEVLKWLHNIGCRLDEPCSHNIRVYAAAGGNVDMMRWLDEQGVP
jgi:hypothetical protein